jgi:hypothetical protein
LMLSAAKATIAIWSKKKATLAARPNYFFVI